MISAIYNDFDEKYPDLVIKLLEYFRVDKENDGPIAKRSIKKFCDKYKGKYDFTKQPWILSAICKRIYEAGYMMCLKSRGGLGLEDNYLFHLNKVEFFESDKDRLMYFFNSIVYGFEYVYKMYKNIVVPLVWERDNGDYSMGTGFKFLDGIVTAKHCITDAKNLQIKGYRAEELKDVSVYISDNESVDVAFIKTGRTENPLIYCDEGKVMDEVLVMGYPKIPAFTSFLTAEKATISSKADARITPTKGYISAYGYEYLTKTSALLITAKIRGGNSGGPVINQAGCVVGIACQIPNYDGEIGSYDDLGYGIAVPSSYLTKIVSSSQRRKMDIPKNFFRDFMV